MNLSYWQDLGCKFILKFIAAFGRGLHYSLGSDKQPPSEVNQESKSEADAIKGREDKPCIVVPLFGALDRCFKTLPEEDPWVLGTMLGNDERYKELKKVESDSSNFKVGPNYTFAMWDMYLDFDRWVLTNIPGMGSLDLHSYWQNEGLEFIMYGTNLFNQR